jgi:hypothetical protein
MQQYWDSLFARPVTMLFRIALFSTLTLFASVKAAAVVPGATWTDTNGNVIQAHGGGLLRVSCQVYPFSATGDLYATRWTQLGTG